MDAPVLSDLQFISPICYSQRLCFYLPIYRLSIGWSSYICLLSMSNNIVVTIPTPLRVLVWLFPWAEFPGVELLDPRVRTV